MAIKLLQKFKRNTSPLHVPEALAEGVSHGPSGTWAWVLIPGRATDEQNTSTIFQMTADGANDLRRLISPGRSSTSRSSGAAGPVMTTSARRRDRTCRSSG